MIKSLGINIVTHNGIEESFLRQALASVSFCADEVIVWDDVSTDNTYWILRKQFPKVIIKKGKERSKREDRASILNELKAMTKSEWILRIDDDEIFPKETMMEIVNVDENIPVYTIPLLHYEDGHFIDPKSHKKDTFYVARLFKNLPEIRWVKSDEVLIYNKSLVSSKGNQPEFCKKLTNPFLHFGELRKGFVEGRYYFHERGHCNLPLGKYEQYIPNQN